METKSIVAETFKKKNSSGLKNLKEAIAVMPFIGPFILLIVLFFFVPVILTGVISFTGMGFSMEMNYVGLKNFIRFFNDSVVPQVVSNTATYAIFTCMINVGFGFFLAVATTFYMKREDVGLGFRTIWLLPRMTPPVVYGLLWVWFLDPTNYGIVNMFLNDVLGLASQNWLLHDPMYIIVVANGMIGASFCMVIFSASIKSIPEDFYRAARVDGASDFLIVRKIIFPALKWPIMFLTIWQTLSLLTSYEYILLITNGGPLFDSEVLALFSYHKAFANFEFGYGAAISVLLVIVGLVVTLVMLKVFGYEKMMNNGKMAD